VCRCFSARFMATDNTIAGTTRELAAAFTWHVEIPPREMRSGRRWDGCRSEEQATAQVENQPEEREFGGTTYACKYSANRFRGAGHDGG
jgi:hypothetical protein